MHCSGETGCSIIVDIPRPSFCLNEAKEATTRGLKSGEEKDGERNTVRAQRLKGEGEDGA
jgi:hypothetical protein